MATDGPSVSGYAAALLASVLECCEDAIVGLSRDGVIETWSGGAELLYGYGAEEAQGQPIAVLERPDDPSTSEHLEAACGGRTVRFEASQARRDGSEVDVEITLSPVRSAGAIIGLVYLARDTRDRRRTENERARADLEEAQRIARLGSWSWDPSTDETSWSMGMYRIFGRDPQLGPAASDAFFAYVHPEDRERLAAGYARAFGGGPGWKLDYRIVAGDGTPRTLHALGHEDPSRAGCYLGTVQDVTVERRAERERAELLETSARAESANRAKSDFLARMSHELRTPLNAIIGFSQLLQLEGLQARQREHVDYVLTAGNHLLELINEVLDIARIEAGHMTVSPEPVLLADTVSDAVVLVAPLAQDHDVSLHVDTDGLAHDGHVQADRHRLKQVLLNLLSNAIKYNHRGGHVDISFQLVEGRLVRTLIADSGIGIQPEQLARLFEPFERLGAELTDVEGTGLGLTLSRGLIHAMGGTIEVDSEPGAGSTFMIELTAAEPPGGVHQRGERDRELASLARSDGQRSRILYVEDNLSNLALVERILQRYPGVELIAAMQGMLGLELAREHRPDLVVLDLHLPDIPGTDVLKRLKAEHVTREIPVIVLTADATKTHAERVRQLGASDFLTKPIDVARFLDAIAANLKSHIVAGP